MADCPLFRAPPTGSFAELTTNIHLLPRSEFEALIAKTFVETDKQTHKKITVEVCTVVKLPQFCFEVGDCEVGDYDTASLDSNTKLWTGPDGQQKSIKLPNHALVDPLETFNEIGRLVDANNHAFDLALTGEGPLKLVAELLASTERGHKEIFVHLRRYVLLALMKTGTAERTDAGRQTDPIINEPGHRLHLKAVISRIFQRQVDTLLSLHLVAAQRTLEASILGLVAEPNQENWEACLLVLLALCQLHEINYEDCKRRAQENSNKDFSNPPWLLEAAQGLLRLGQKVEDGRAKLPQPDKAVQLCLPSIQNLCIPKTSAPAKHTYDWFLEQGIAQGSGDLEGSV